MMNWTDKFPGCLYKKDHIHIWKASLDYNAAIVNSVIGFLSADEVERANRFYFKEDRRQFVVRRGILKQIITKYLDIDPKDLLFGYNSFGKPFIHTDFQQYNLKFNMSYSKNMALYAISYEKEVGIDIEYLQKHIEFQQIIDRFFSQKEIEYIQKINSDQRKEEFFKIWTRKEAILKALGKGLSFPLQMVDVPINRSEFKFRFDNDGDHGKESLWHVRDLLPANNYIGSIAIERPESEFFFSHFTF